MKPDLIIIDRLSQLKELGEYLYGKKYVAYDCETTGTTSRHEVIGFSICAEEDKAFYVVLAKWNGKLEYIQEEGYQQEAKLLIHYLKSFDLIMHNGVFDAMMAE